MTPTQHADTVLLTVTVPVEEVPPVTVVGLSDNDDKLGPGGGGLTLSVVCLVKPSAVAVMIENWP